MTTANFVESIIFYTDTESASNPQRKVCDWRRADTGLTFDKVYSERFSVAPGATQTLESVIGLTDLSATPVDLIPNVAKTTWYQYKGAFAASPWAAALAVSGQPLTITVQVDGNVLVTGAGLASLSAVVPGDQVYFAGTQYGDTGSISATNQGFWDVVSVGTGLLLRRTYDEDLSVTETVTTSSVYDVQLLADATRPRWLFVRGASTYSGLYPVVAAARGWIAVTAPSQFTPATTITFDRLLVAPKYIAYLRVESDMPVTLKVGDVATAINEVSIQPISSTSGWYESFSFVSSIAVQNRGSNQAASIYVIYAFASEPS